jgi:putative ABC transport system substrate-binding protein
MKKKIVAAVLTVACVTSLLAGCTSSSTSSSTATEGAETSTEAAEDTDSATATSDESYTIGISQFAEHGSLDNCREGFLEGLAEEGIVEGENLTIIEENAQADTGTASTISDSFVSKNVDLICAIATPSAMSAYNSCLDTEIPVVYTAVSDPVAAGLADEDGVSTGNVTGTADSLPVAEQLEMIRTMMPDATTIGILYTTSETNSVSTIETYKELAGDYGFEIVDTGINTIADVEMAAKDMVTKVDCITNLTDNTVVSALQTVLAAANDQGIPVFGSEIEQVKNGCLASMGIDYVELGKQTGEMAAKILKGESTAAEMNFETCKGANLYVNTAVAENLNFELDQDYIADAVETFDEIVVE